MKVYVYKKKDKHKRIEEINGAIRIEEKEDRFTITADFKRYEYHKDHYMISIFGY